MCFPTNVAGRLRENDPHSCREAPFFCGARFGNGATFEFSKFGWVADFSDTVFGDGAYFGPLLVAGNLELAAAAFNHPSVIEVSAQELNAKRLALPNGGVIRVRWAKIDLGFASLPGPTLIVAGDVPMEFGVLPVDEAVVVAHHLDPRLRNARTGELDPRPRLVSLHHTDLSQLTLNGVNLERCCFGDAHHVDGVSLEGDTTFAKAPSVFSWNLLGGQRYEVLAEERAWRLRRRGRLPWRRASSLSWEEKRDEERDQNLSMAEPLAIAGTYRALRKSLEESKNEPGAAAFYYGEMEMRRHAAAGIGERLLLTAYWATSGYALRGLRALAWLLALLVLAAWQFNSVGFDRSAVPGVRADRIASSTGDIHYTTFVTPAPNYSFADGLEFSIDTATSLLHSPSTWPLTTSGKVTAVGLRLAGPLLLALALLSLRGRVKR